MATTTSALDSFDVWHVRDASTVQHLKSVAYGAGQFIAVGAQGVMVTSSNGVDWSVSSPFGTNNLNTVVYHENRFFVGGNKGLIRWSQDGASWTSASAPITNDVTAIGFGRGRFVTNGVFVASAAIQPIQILGATLLLNSEDGQNWRLETNLFLSPTTIIFGQDRFVASAGAPALSPNPWISYDGRNWQSVALEIGPVAFGGGLFVLPQRFNNSSNGITLLAKTSTNAQSWLPSNVGNGIGSQPISASFVGGRFVATGGPGLIATSVDGTNWMTHFPQIDAVLRSVAYGNGTFVAVGDRAVILTSSNGTDWVRRSTTGLTLRSVAPADDGFVAVGISGTVATSDDGVHWQRYKLPETNSLTAAVRAKGTYVVVGENGVILSGETVTNLTVPRIGGTTEHLEDAVFGNQMFVAVGGRETIISSPNGIDWTVRNVGASNRLQKITYGANRFVTVGERGVVFTSDDGINWTYRNSGTSQRISGLTYGNGRFVAACNQTFILTSTDGIEWKLDSTVRPWASTGIHFANGYFLASVQGGSVLPAILLTSADGEVWTTRTDLIGWWNMDVFISGGSMIRDLAYNNGTLVGVGVYGLILQSDPIFRLDITRGEDCLIGVHGPTNKIYQIESADALGQGNLWTERVTLSQPPFTWVDQSPNGSNRQYRAVLVP